MAAGGKLVASKIRWAGRLQGRNALADLRRQRSVCTPTILKDAAMGVQCRRGQHWAGPWAAAPAPLTARPSSPTNASHSSLFAKLSWARICTDMGTGASAVARPPHAPPAVPALPAYTLIKHALPLLSPVAHWARFGDRRYVPSGGDSCPPGLR